MKYGRRFAVTCRAGAAGIALAAAATHAAAQGTESPSSAHGFEEIIVTATKRAESLQDVPISVAVISGNMINELGLSRFEDLQSTIPNVQIDNSLGAPSIFIRGMGSGASNFSFEQSVGLFVDGVYSGRSRFFTVPLFDVAQVEIVRGPQGALFGRNTNAGAVSITTAKPTDERFISLRGGYEVLYDGYFLEGIASGPLSDTFGVRVAGTVNREGGYLRNHATGKREPVTDTWYLRGTAVWKPSDGFSATLRVEGGKVDQDGGVFQLFNRGTAALADLWFATDPNAEDNLDLNRSVIPLLPEFDDTDTLNGSLTIEIPLGDHTLTSITAAGGVNNLKSVEYTGTSLQIAASTLGENFDQWSQEVRLSSPTGGAFEYILGVLYTRHKLKTLQESEFNNFGPFTGVSTRTYHERDRAISPFLSATWSPIEQLTLIGGLRYTDEVKRGRTSHVASGVIFPTYLPYSYSGRRHEKHFTPSLTVQYKPSRELMLYALYATGTKAGGFLSNDATLQARILAGTNDYEFEEETAKSYEVGVKATLFGGKGLLNVAAFQTDFDDLQVSNFNGDFFITNNAAKARSKGIEADFRANVAEGVTLSLSGAYLDGKFREYPNGPCIDVTPNPDCSALQTQDLGGYRLQRAPKWTGSTNLDIRRPIGSDLAFGGTFNVNYKSKYYGGQNLSEYDAEKAFAKINARLAIGASDDRWQIAVVGRNLTNKLTKNWSFPTPAFGGNAHTTSISQPRMITIEAQTRF